MRDEYDFSKGERGKFHQADPELQLTFPRSSRRIQSRTKRHLYGNWFVCLLWNCLATPMGIYTAVKSWGDDNLIGGFVALLFPILGAAGLLYVVTRTLDYYRFGTVVFEMSPFPGVVGGQVGGVVEIPRLLVGHQSLAGKEFTVQLRCQDCRVYESVDSRRVDKVTLWQDSRSVIAQRTESSVILTFAFQVPLGLPASNEDADPNAGQKEFSTWELAVTSELASVCFQRHFIVPVL